MQRMLLQLQRYDLDIIYKPGKEMLIADTLSRAVIQDQDTSEDDMSDVKVVYALEPTDTLSIGSLEKLKGETQKDDALQLLQSTDRKGWPHHKKQVDMRMAQYWSIRHTVRHQTNGLGLQYISTVPAQKPEITDDFT